MAMPVTDYTDADSIRAAMGVSPVELADAKVQDMKLEAMVLSELSEWLPTHATVYATGIATGATAQEQQDASHLELYCTFLGASKINLFALAIKQSATDGKNALKRFEGMDFEALAAGLLAQANLYRQRLEASVNSATAATPTQIIGRAVPGYDPITNE